MSGLDPSKVAVGSLALFCIVTAAHPEPAAAQSFTFDFPDLPNLPNLPNFATNSPNLPNLPAGRAWQMSPATSSTRTFNPRIPSQMASYDMAENICQARSYLVSHGVL